ncbi:NADH dehydrogenase [ubiquinone] 1 beta subcomplex subunit 4 [Fopius arisanus]|uniref:NADH dehydrogenase [ubiquinone] 1 beta subcomplex subunit 4 n=1 Tax=Fopius arisanus TaxID=64838 RepID=A0A9R1TDZ5_9HYME|nr:PREDICTED: NADH dehydrogenase [ubiquinone] 1 beta subcomplex subunit 4 [Fopius arisanus]
MSGRETFDISPVQRKILEERQKRATALRHDYLQQRLNPFRHALGIGGTVEDPAILRFQAHRATMYERFKPTWGNAAFSFSVTILPMIIGYIIVGGDKDRTEHKRRTGQVSYHDREDKFL